MPGLSERVFIKACKKNGLQGQAKILSLSDDQWDSVEDECAKLLNLPPHWRDVEYDKSVKNLKAQDKAAGHSEFKLYTKRDLMKDREEKKKSSVKEEDSNLVLF